ncbi:hypothetical protein DPMN_051072, partial [Dreissena polymorpha]
GPSIQLGRSIAGNGNLVNAIVSNPEDTSLDNDFVTFYSADSFSWLSLGSSNGNIQVTSSVSTSAGTYSKVYCARNRRSKTTCATLSITVYDSYVSNSPAITSLHENTDALKNLWTITAKCDISYTCGGFTCSAQEDCDSCTVSNTQNFFAMSGTHTVYKKECLTPLCDTCSVSNYCANQGEIYTYTVSCVRTNTFGYSGFTSGTATKTVSLSFFADVNPPFAYDSSIGNSINIGKGIPGTGQMVNRIFSNPEETTDDNDVPVFWRSSGDNPAWLTVVRATGEIKVTSSLTSETATSMSIVMCAENRRHQTTCQTLTIQIYHMSITNNPSIVSLHENTDIDKLLWTITGTCDISYQCFSVYTCAQSHVCDSCAVTDTYNFFYVDGTHAVHKKECLTPLCDTCSVGNYCADRGETYTYTVSCIRTNTFGYSGFTSGTATKTVSLSFFADVNPPFAYDSSIGNSINIGKGIPGTGQMVNRIFSNPEETTDDNDVPVFWRSSGDNPAWLTVVRATGEIKVTSSLTSETATSMSIVMCAENRRHQTTCQTLTIQIYHMSITNNPSNDSLHENTDIDKLLWTITGTCDISYQCFSVYTCAQSHVCDSCAVTDTYNFFYVDGTHAVHKKKCLTPLCDTCSVGNYCANRGETYNYTVSCVRTNTFGYSGFTSGTATKTVSLSFFADVNPPFAFDSSLGNSINIGKSIPGTGQMVNRIFSNPEETTDDNDVPVFWRSSGDNPAWLTVVRATGEIKVTSALTSETATSMSMVMCAENRRHQKTCQTLNITIYYTSITNNPSIVRLHENTDRDKLLWNVTGTCDITYQCFSVYTCAETHVCDSCVVTDTYNFFYIDEPAHDVHKKTCLKPLCEPCYISDFCVNEAETYNYTVDCVKTNYNSFSQFTTGHAVRTPSLYFYTDIIPPFKYDDGNNIVVFQNNSYKDTIINKIISNPVNESDDNDEIFYYTDRPPRPSWIHENILFVLDTSNGFVKVNKTLEFEFSYTFDMRLCVRNRRQFINCDTFNITLWACYQTPNCTDQEILDLNDTHGIYGHSNNKSLFQMIYKQPTYHFPNFRNTWSNLTWTLDNGGFIESTINPLTGEIYLTQNISIWPSWPTRHYIETVTVANSESCYTTTCQMDVTIWYTNWKPRISSLPAQKKLHEDTDAETLLHNLEVYDYNYDRPADGHALEDNSTCWIEYVFDQWGENDMELFELKEDPNNPKRWNSYSLYKRECNVSGSPYTPPCGYKRENFTCPKHTGCMTHNVTQWYDVSIRCRDGYGAEDNRNFSFYPEPNVAPEYSNLPKSITLNVKTGSEHDIIFSTMYRDAENENLTYEYTFVKQGGGDVTYFKGDPSGNYFNQLGNVSLTTYMYETPNATYKILICGHERRNEICEYLTVDFRDYCGPTPECNSNSTTVTSETPAGTVIFSVAVTNAALYTSLEFSLTAQYANMFDINASTGIVKTTSKLAASYPSTTYSLNAFVTDVNSCGFYSVCPLTLVVTYINFPLNITNLPATVTIKEDTPYTVTLFTVMTSDQNTNDEVICAITNPNDNKPFYMVETFTGSGVYVVKNYVAGTNTARQLSSAKLSYNVSISCNDTIGQGDTGDLTIDVIPNEGPSLTTIINGTEPWHVDQSVMFKGAVLWTESAKDPEGDALTYTCTVNSSNNPLTCAVDKNTLSIKMRRNVSIGRENDKVFSIDVCVGDEKHVNHSCGTLTILFTAKHTYPSITNLPNITLVPEDKAVGSTLFEPVVFDLDVPVETKQFSMKVVPASASSYFLLDKTTGFVTLAKGLDYETTSSYSLYIDVKDPYLSSQSSGRLIINVTNVNEPNTLTAKKTTISFKETRKVGTSFNFGLRCTDADDFDTQTFSIKSGAHKDYFRMDSSSPLIYLTKSWDLDDTTVNLPTSTMLVVQCEDSVGLTSAVYLNFLIEDVNDHKPEFAYTLPPGQNDLKFKLASNASLSTSLLTLSATDPNISFGILGNGLGRKYFRMEKRVSRKRATSTTAELKLRQPLDFSNTKTFSFYVKISDGGTPPQFSALEITVEYSPDPHVPKAADISKCLTCSKSGQSLIAVLAVECAIALGLIVHGLFATGIIGSSDKIRPITTNTPGNMRYINNKNRVTQIGNITKEAHRLKIQVTAIASTKKMALTELDSNSDSSSSSESENDQAVHVNRRRDNVAKSGFFATSRLNRYAAKVSSDSGFPAPVYDRQIKLPHTGSSLRTHPAHILSKSGISSRDAAGSERQTGGVFTIANPANAPRSGASTGLPSGIYAGGSGVSTGLPGGIYVGSHKNGDRS